MNGYSMYTFIKVIKIKFNSTEIDNCNFKTAKCIIKLKQKKIHFKT